jgi:hypothetical protein
VKNESSISPALAATATEFAAVAVIVAGCRGSPCFPRNDDCDVMLDFKGAAYFARPGEPVDFRAVAAEALRRRR